MSIAKRNFYLPGIFILYLYDPISPFLNAISTSTRNLPAVLSAKNPLLSKVMDVYTKTSPLLCFFIITQTNDYKK
ncbi:hypothetical protein BTJ39_20670 [Izhakiella australiensis]|uniref:Uncharacterized protein n=1 Tax=Izhakiella australiensis TaxID=1926881 RepID=A0A1S8YEF1_9GAMM|nr:hypothetical protein BTJ39_20670 [Izhakiella australiensis]